MAIKKGYKQTEVGVIPEDWNVNILKNLSERIIVGIASAATHAYRTKGVPMFRNQNITPSGLDCSDLLFISTEYENQFRNKRLKSGDLLTMRTGYPGVTAIVPNEYEGAQSFTTLITRPNTYCVMTSYLCCYINSAQGHKFFEQSQIGGAQKNVNVATLKTMPIPLPPLAEQEAIAGALSDADAWIESLEQLIAKKRQIKQGAMQELLTGKRRLPGFSGEWETKRLGDLGSFLKGSGVRKNEANSGDIPCVRYGEIYTHHNDYIRRFNSSISRAVAEAATRMNYGDLLFAGSGETKAEIGKCVAYAHDMEAYAGGDIVILRSIKSVPIFMGYYCNTRAIAEQKAARGQGDAVVHISASALAGVQICVPEIHEQTAIATVLSDMDTEIESLEEKLAKAREIKQGMMQELLTGRIRLA